MLRGICLLGVVCLVTACADNPPAPIEDRSGGRRPTPQPAPPTPSAPVASPQYGPQLTPGVPYTVRRGDTLYSIAFRLGEDYKALASWNRIGWPYTIFPGQKLVTGPAVKASKAAPAPASKAPASRPKQATRKSTPRATTPTVTPQPKPAVAAKPSAPATSKAKALGPVSRWRWPSAGRVVRSYSTSLHKGIDIAGKRGDPVRSVADGEVVYSGTGVTGYGALLIVKHNDEYLSAYGHNDGILVEEGARVAAGQQIAQMGSTGTDTVKLHFEIRRQGKPVDPLKILPRR